MKKYYLLLLLVVPAFKCFAQNVGVGTATPAGKLHIKGSADTSQLVIDAGATQSNIRPLIRLRNAAGGDLMHIHTDAEFNVFMGFAAGKSNSVHLSRQEGLYNTFIGSNSGFYNDLGSFNTALGRSSLYQNTDGIINTALGYKSLFSNTTAIANTAVGAEAMLSNIAGGFNTALGAYALRYNTYGGGNTALGSNALGLQSYTNLGVPWQTYNTAVGYNALNRNEPTTDSNGSDNTAVGGNALFNNTTGFNNTATGSEALASNTVGTANTAIGVDALKNNTTGLVNMGLGFGSGTHFNTPTISNTVGIANYDALNGASNQVIIGNNSMVFTGGHVNWGIYSDARIKKNVLEDVKGLDFITRLRPVTYNRSIKAFTQLTGNPEGPEFEGKYDVENIRFSGFLAQEVAAAAKDAGYNFDGVYEPKNERELYKLSYGSLVVPLVKAVQEQQQIIRQQQQTIKTQQQQIADILERLKVLEQKN